MEGAAATVHGVRSDEGGGQAELGPTITAPIKVNGMTTKALVDTGSPVTIASTAGTGAVCHSAGLESSYPATTGDTECHSMQLWRRTLESTVASLTLDDCIDHHQRRVLSCWSDE